MSEIAPRILILEDDQDMREMLADVLDSEGYQTFLAADGEQAVTLAGKTSFDLMIIDVRMPGMGGLEALARMRHQQPGAASMVVTGYASESDSIRALRLGVGDYLKKPFPVPEFLERVSQLLSEARLQRQRQHQHQQLYELLRYSIRRMDPQVIRVEQWAARLASQLALSPEVSAEIRLSALLAAGPAARGELSELLELVSSPLIRRGLRHAGEHWDGSGGPDHLKAEEIPLEARVLALALRLSRELETSQMDPHLVALALADVEADAAAPETVGDADSADRLLCLGQALERAGDPRSSLQAYQQLLQTYPRTRQSVEAWLGVARLGGPQPMNECISQAVGLARRLGPGCAGRCLLEAGEMLAGESPSRSEELLREAIPLLQESRRAGGWARANLALSSTWGQPEAVEHYLKILLQPEHWPDLSEASFWLLNRLLDSPPSGLQRRALMVLVRQLPGQVLGQLARLTPAQRQQIAACGPSHPPLLEALANDPEPTVRQQMGQQRASDTLPTLRLQSFGSFEVWRGEERIGEGAWKTQKVRYLLAYLAAAAPREIPEERVLDEFWPDDAERGRRNLNDALSALRKAIRCGVQPDFDPIVRHQGLIRLHPDLPRWHDHEEFEKAIARRESSRVVELYRGPYLEGCYWDWAGTIRRRCEQQVMVHLSLLLAANPPLPLQVELASRLLELDRCSQEGHLALIRAYQAMGRNEEAVRQYQICQRSLKEELDLEPGLAIFEAYQRARLSL
ncbi:MAG: response regulator [Vulcanimicrobiota bacterium]